MDVTFETHWGHGSSGAGLRGGREPQAVLFDTGDYDGVRWKKALQKNTTICWGIARGFAVSTLVPEEPFKANFKLDLLGHNSTGRWREAK